MESYSFIIDAAVVLIFIVFVLEGRHKGFVKTILSLVATAAAIFTAYSFSGVLAQWANEAFVGNVVTEAIARLISSKLDEGTQAVANAVPEYITSAMQANGLSVSELVSGIGSSVDVPEAAEQIYGAISGIIVMPVLTVIAFLIIYVIISFILSFVVSAIDKFFKLPVLRSLNKMLGGIAGGIKGVAIAVVICLVLGAAGLFLTGEIGQAIENSFAVSIVTDIILK